MHSNHAVGSQGLSWVGLGRDGRVCFTGVETGSGFRLPDAWVWCGSPIRGDDGRYHLFASRWPRALAFSPHWLTNSEVVRAVADRPMGPYTFCETVLPPRGEAFWDGRMTHNPTVHRFRDRFFLYYTGTTYDGPAPCPARPIPPSDPGNLDDPAVVPAVVVQSHAAQRIGVAVSRAPEGPWTRPSEPLLLPRPGRWDGLITTNPAVCIRPDGYTLLVYKSVERRGGTMHLGVAAAADPAGPFERLSDEPIVAFDDEEDDLEDPCLWWSGDHYEMLAKCMEGRVCTQPRAGLLFRSTDGVAWSLVRREPAYTRNLEWIDGQRTQPAFLERPQVLIENGRLTHIFFATAVGSEHIGQVTDAWNQPIPLHPDTP